MTTHDCLKSNVNKELSLTVVLLISVAFQLLHVSHAATLMSLVVTAAAAAGGVVTRTQMCLLY